MGTQRLGFEQELKQILAQIQIMSPECFVFKGEQVQVTRSAFEARSTLAENQPLVVPRLQEHLYQCCYCLGPGSENVTSQPALPNGEEFLLELSRANKSVPRWDANWRVTQMENTGGVWAEKGGVLRVFQPGEFVKFMEPGSPVRMGSTISAYIAKESTTVQPGFYFAFGETVTSSDNLDLFRLYWNIDARGVINLMRLISRDLNRFQVPFQFKCPVLPQGYVRRDAAVLYVKKRFHELVRELAMTWHDVCNLDMGDDVPLFTLPLAPGLGLAEDPETGESFGMNRCRHVAEALWSAHSQNCDKAQYLQAVKEQFNQFGLDFNRPYLNAGSVDIYNRKPGASGN